MAHRLRLRLVHYGPWTWPWRGARRSSCSRPIPATGQLVLKVQFCLLSRLGRRRTGGGASAQKGDGTGAVEGRRRRVGVWGASLGLGLPFMGTEARRGAGVSSMAGDEGGVQCRWLLGGEMKREGII
jgi:hypothetical protein